jgi:hypothetical protein
MLQSAQTKPVAKPVGHSAPRTVTDPAAGAAAAPAAAAAATPPAAAAKAPAAADADAKPAATNGPSVGRWNAHSSAGVMSAA